MSAPDGPPPPPLARFVGRRPATGAAVAAKAVMDDVSALVRAEIDLAKAEVSEGLKAKGVGAGLFAAAGVLAWLGLNALLVTLGFVLAIWLPGWAAALIVTVLLFGGAAVAALIGKKMMEQKVSLDTAKASVATDVEVARTELQHAATIKRPAP